MKYICLGYFDEKKWETMSESERNAMMDECFTYDDVLRKSGHFVGGGAPLFKDIKDRIALKLLKATTWSSGIVGLYYQKA